MKFAMIKWLLYQSAKELMQPRYVKSVDEIKNENARGNPRGPDYWRNHQLV